MMHPHPLSSRHRAGDYLAAALSHRAPRPLPYKEDTKWLLRTHLLALMEVFPSLSPTASFFTHNDGRDAFLLKAEGTVPAVFAGVVYHFPVTIWLLESYPFLAPSVFLLPSRDMAVVPGHIHVDSSGHVSVPYLLSWSFPTSNLVDLVRSLSDVFGKDPPLYTVPNLPPSPGPALATAPSTVPSSRFREPAEPRRTDVLRKSLMDNLVEKVQRDMRTHIGGEMEGLLALLAELRQREGVMAAGVAKVLEEKDLLEQRLQELMIDTDVLGKWVLETWEIAIRRGHGVVPDEDMFEPCDELSRQLLECTSENLAMEDTLYALDRGLQEGVLPSRLYLKNVRALARKQAYCQALQLRIAAAQAKLRAGERCQPSNHS